MDSVLGQRASTEIIENAYGPHSTVFNSGTTSTTTETKPFISDEEWTKTYSAGYGSTTAVNKNDTDSRGGGGGGDGGGGNIIQDDDGSGSGSSFFAEIPAIIVTLMINFMTAIPFGVAYFPLGWNNNNNGGGGGGTTDGDATTTDDASGSEDGISGPFPLPGM
jgi:hypothetical protein